jgi:hypothetical protein
MAAALVQDLKRRSAARARFAWRGTHRPRRLPQLPFGERQPIALERVIVEIEYARIAATMTTILELGLHGRHRLRVVLR